MAASSTIQPKRDQFLDPRWRLSNLYWITDETGREDGARVNYAPPELDPDGGSDHPRGRSHCRP
jgi:hypothetical protein